MKLQKRNIIGVCLVLGMGFGLTSCYDPTQKADPENLNGDDQGVEYAPQMYHSEAYDPMSQVMDEESGLNYWPFNLVSGGSSDYKNLEEGHGEWYNSNYYNEHSTNMRTPPANTVARGQMPYELGPDDYDLADTTLSPGFVIERTPEGELTSKGEEQLADCEGLYVRFCSHCHGIDGTSPGKVGEKFGAVPKYTRPDLVARSEGYIFHVITYGKSTMRPHASQLDPSERWKIAAYVKELQANAAK